MDDYVKGEIISSVKLIDEAIDNARVALINAKMLCHAVDSCNKDLLEMGDYIRKNYSVWINKQIKAGKMKEGEKWSVIVIKIIEMLEDDYNNAIRE